MPYDVSSGAGTITKGFTDLVGTDKPFGQLRIWNPNLRPQFTQQWNLTLEYQLFRNTSVTAAYVGHWATHLVAPTDINQPLPGIGPAAMRRHNFGLLTKHAAHFSASTPM